MSPQNSPCRSSFHAERRTDAGSWRKEGAQTTPASTRADSDPRRQCDPSPPKQERACLLEVDSAVDAVVEVVTAAADEVVSAEVVSPPFSRPQDTLLGQYRFQGIPWTGDASAGQQPKGRRDEGDWNASLQPMSSRTGNPAVSSPGCTSRSA